VDSYISLEGVYYGSQRHNRAEASERARKKRLMMSNPRHQY